MARGHFPCSPKFIKSSHLAYEVTSGREGSLLLMKTIFQVETKAIKPSNERPKLISYKIFLPLLAFLARLIL
jgi:hypothetical protein